MDKQFDTQAIMDELKKLKPVAAPCSPEVRTWWETTALSLLRDQALSELRRHDEMPPRIFGFMNKDGSDMAIVNVADAMGGNWGSQKSKDATAFIHKITALLPGTYASVFASEVWAVHGQTREELDRNHEKYPNLGDHPDRYEMVMFHMLHYEWGTNQMMQLSTMIEIEKVLGNRSRLAWQHTKLSDKVKTGDPLFPKGDSEMRMTGRFVFDGEEEPE